jgi:hypothetical protein
MYKKIHSEIIIYVVIQELIHSEYWISRFPHADQILPKLPAPHKKLSQPDVEDRYWNLRKSLQYRQSSFPITSKTSDVALMLTNFSDQ